MLAPSKKGIFVLTISLKTPYLEVRKTLGNLNLRLHPLALHGVPAIYDHQRAFVR